MMFRIFDKSYFDKAFSTPDPWGYFSSQYEMTKYVRQLWAIREFCPSSQNILEVGCAEGVFTAMLAEAFPQARIVGVDISQIAIDRATERCKHHPNVTLVQADAIDLFQQGRLSHQRFDVILQSESLHYIFVRLVFRLGFYSYLREITRLLNKKGIFITSNGINIQTRFMLEIGYLILSRLCQPVWAANYREWNDFKGRYLNYDLRVFRTK